MVTIALTPEAQALRDLIERHREEFQVLLDRYAASSPKLFGSAARGTASAGSDIDTLVEMDPADGNLLMRASGLLEETRELLGRDDIDIFPDQLLKRQISASAVSEAVELGVGVCASEESVSCQEHMFLLQKGSESPPQLGADLTALPGGSESGAVSAMTSG